VAYAVIVTSVVGAAYIAGMMTGSDAAPVPTTVTTTVKKVKEVPVSCIEAMDDANAVVMYSVDALTLAADGLEAFVTNRPEAGGQKLVELNRAMTPVSTALDDYQVNEKECRKA
jgi:hypothetical protein